MLSVPRNPLCFNGIAFVPFQSCRPSRHQTAHVAKTLPTSSCRRHRSHGTRTLRSLYCSHLISDRHTCTSAHVPHPPLIVSTLSRNSSTQNLCPEETTLCPLNHLLVDGLWRVVHDDSALLVIDLGIYSRVPNEINDPLLSLVLVQSETG